MFADRDENGRLAGQKKEETDAAVQKMSASYVDGSIEKTNEVRHLQPKNGLGAYCLTVSLPTLI